MENNQLKQKYTELCNDYININADNYVLNNENTKLNNDMDIAKDIIEHLVEKIDNDTITIESK